MSCFLDTGLGNLWEVPMEGSNIIIIIIIILTLFLTEVPILDAITLLLSLRSILINVKPSSRDAYVHQLPLGAHVSEITKEAPTVQLGR
jgi:hypothetical protein